MSFYFCGKNTIFLSMNHVSLTNIYSEFKNSIQVALPLIASEVIYALSGFVATAMIAHFGKAELAANALVWEIYIVVIVFFIGIFCSVSIMVSQSFGAHDIHSISVCFKQGVIMTIMFTPLMIFIMWLAPEVLILTKQDPLVIELARPFFHSLMWTMLPLSIMFVIEQFLIGIARTKIVLLMSILIVPLQIFFFYVFLFGKFGVLQLGLAGIGYGLTISYSLVVLFFICYLQFSRLLKPYQLFNKWWILKRKVLLELIRVGLPLGFMFGIEVALFVAVAIMMGLFGITTLAAYQIAYQYIMLALAFIFALTQTVTVRIGNEVGKNNRNALQLVNMALGFGFMLIFSIFYIGFPRFVIGLDIDIHAPDLQQLVYEATVFLSMAGILILIDCLRLINAGALRGLKDTTVPLIISILGFWGIAFPAAYLLAFRFGVGEIGIWWGIMLGLFIAAITLFIRFKRLVRDSNLVALVTRIE